MVHHVQDPGLPLGLLIYTTSTMPDDFSNPASDGMQNAIGLPSTPRTEHPVQQQVMNQYTFFFSSTLKEPGPILTSRRSPPL